MVDPFKAVATQQNVSNFPFDKWLVCRPDCFFFLFLFSSSFIFSSQSLNAIIFLCSFYTLTPLQNVLHSSDFYLKKEHLYPMNLFWNFECIAKVKWFLLASCCMRAVSLFSIWKIILIGKIKKLYINGCVNGECIII